MMKRNFVTAQMKKLLVLFLALMMMVSGTLLVNAEVLGETCDVKDDDGYGIKFDYYNLVMTKDGTWVNVEMSWSGMSGMQSYGTSATYMKLGHRMIFNGNDDPIFSYSNMVAERISNSQVYTSGIRTSRGYETDKDAYRTYFQYPYNHPNDPDYTDPISILHTSFNYYIDGKDIVTKQEFGVFAEATVNGRDYEAYMETGD